jgi:hypothetical protein
MKKIYAILLIIIVVIIGVFVFFKHQIIGTELEISFVTEQKHTPKDMAADGLLNFFDWLILTDEGQKENWEEEGYVIPYVDFSKNFLIISRYKISKLYKAGYNECEGVPDGKAIFDKKNSNKNFYYFYLMPKIWFSQGVG